MNDIQESLLQSMQLLAESAAHKTQGTMIIDAEIVEVLDEGKGLYSVNYTGNKFEAYAIAEVAYSVGDKVSVLIPNGDFSSQKKILGGSSATTSIVDTKVEAHYVQVSENLIESISDEVIKLCTYTPEAKQYTTDASDGFGVKYPTYAKEHTHFALSADFKTNIPMEQRGGDFGLSVTLPYYYLNENDEKVASDKTYTLNIEKLKGNPYQLLEWAPQSYYFEIPKNLIFDNSREAIITAYTDEKFVVDAGKTGQYDIFIKNINFHVVDVLTTDEKNGYYLSILSNTGSFFLKGEYGEKTLTPHLRIKNRATSVEGYPCYWFVEDSSIEMDSLDYLHQGGLGWRCLNEKISTTKTENGTEVYNYATNKHSHTISDEDVYVTLRYKCVVDYNGYLVSSIIEIINLNNDITIELLSNSGSFVYPQGIGNVDLICRITGLDESLGGILSYNWERHDKQGERLNYEIETVKLNEWNGNVCSTEIKFKTATVDFLNTVYCTVTWTVNKDGQIIKRILGTRRVVVSTSNDFTYRLEIDNDNVIYKYDPDGNSPMVANYDGVPSSVVKSIQPLGFRVFKADGSELTSDEYLYCKATWVVPKESLIQLPPDEDNKPIWTSEDDTNYYVETTGNQFTLPYKIANCYNARLKYNTIMLEVVFDNTTLTQSANIAFLKDGESGTNGTKYAVQLICNDYAYGEKREDGSVKNFTPVFAYQPGEWYVDDESLSEANYAFKVKVYRDGAEITNSAGEYTVELSMLDPEYTNPCFDIDNKTGKLTPLLDDFAWLKNDDEESIKQNYCNILVAKVTIKDVTKETDEGGVANFTNSEETIYSYYPIDIGYVSMKTDDILNENNESETVDLATAKISGGFGHVLYASDGTNPKYDNTNVFVATDSYGETYYKIKWSAIGNLTLSSNDTNATVMPFSHLNNGVVKNLVRVDMSPDTKKIPDILSNLRNYKQTLRTEKENISAEQTALTNFLEAWKHEKWTNYLEVAKPFIVARAKCIEIADDIINRKIKSFQEYCNRYEASLSQVLDYKTLCADAKTAIETEIETLYAYAYVKDQSITAVKHLSASLLEEVVKKENEIKNVVGIPAYQMIYSYAYEYRTGTVLFNNAVDELEVGSSTAKIRFYNLANEIETFISSNTVSTLKEKSVITPQYKDIIDIIKVYFNFLTDKSERIYTYDDIKKQVLDATFDLIKQYGEPSASASNGLKPTSYIDNYYTGLKAQNNIDMESAEAREKHYKAAAAIKESVQMFYLKPIVMIYNRYEMTALNGWDGNKLYTDDAGTYLLAPQIGAGKKELDNSFTGIVMGTKKVKNKDAETGLFGFGHGIQTIFLDANTGRSEFGASGSGQIIIDPTQRDENGNHLAVLKSGNYHPPHKGMGVEGVCDITNSCPGAGMLIDLTTPGIHFGTGNFSVDAYGNLIAKSGQIANCTITEHGFTNLLEAAVYDEMYWDEVDKEWKYPTINSTIDARADKIMLEVKRVEGDVVANSATITVLDDRITTEVTERTSADNGLSSRIDQTANQIVLKVFTNKNGERALAEAALGTASTEDGPVSFFKVGADSIALRGNEFITLMSGGTINISAETGISIKSPNFSLTQNGFNIGRSQGDPKVTIGSCSINEKGEFDITDGKISLPDENGNPTQSTLTFANTMVNNIAAINGKVVLTAGNPGEDGTCPLATIAMGDIDKEGVEGNSIKIGANNIYLTAEETINFMANGTIDLKAQNISINSDCFKVYKGKDEEGNDIQKVEIEGIIKATAGGDIGGWSITGLGLSAESPGQGTIEILSNGSISAKGKPTTEGETAQWSINADGSVNFTKGIIGGWTFSEDKGFSGNGFSEGYEGRCIITPDGNLTMTEVKTIKINTSFIATDSIHISDTPMDDNGSSTDGLSLSPSSISFGSISPDGYAISGTTITNDSITLFYTDSEASGITGTSITGTDITTNTITAKNIKGPSNSVKIGDSFQISNSLMTFSTSASSLYCGTLIYFKESGGGGISAFQGSTTLLGSVTFETLSSTSKNTIKDVINETYVKGFINDTYIKSFIDKSYITNLLSGTYASSSHDHAKGDIDGLLTSLMSLSGRITELENWVSSQDNKTAE